MSIASSLMLAQNAANRASDEAEPGKGEDTQESGWKTDRKLRGVEWKPTKNERETDGGEHKANKPERQTDSYERAAQAA